MVIRSSRTHRTKAKPNNQPVVGNKARELDNSISWLDLLEGVNTFVSAIRTKVEKVSYEVWIDLTLFLNITEECSGGDLQRRHS